MEIKEKLKGIEEIMQARWVHQEHNNCWVLTVHDKDNYPVVCYLSLRPGYCDRGHIMLQIDGRLSLDWADSFPRYFFNQEEADTHTREFLIWRLWKHTRNPRTLKFEY